MSNPQLSLLALEQRLKALEDEKRVSHCMHHYMQLCDQLDVGTDLKPLMALFSEAAVWEGKGSRYANSFGRFEGRIAINVMFAKYTKPPAHFVLNVHFLTNEQITVEASSEVTSATGSWILIQPSTFTSGKSQLSSARISAKFIIEDDQWRISHFETCNVFSRPMASPWDNAAPLPVPK